MSASSAPAEGADVVLLHGWGGSAASDWDANGWPGSLARQRRTALAVDLPGHGPRPQSHAAEDYADLAAGVLPKLPADGPLDAVGFSLGAKVLLELAVRNPRRFRRLVLGGLGDNAFAPEPVGQELADALVTGVRPDTPAAVRELAAYGVGNGNDPLALAACLRRTANPVLTRSRLARVTCPVLLVVGEHDHVARPVHSLVHALPDARERTLPGVAHLDLPASAGFRRLALDFLEAAPTSMT